jgi:fructose-specific component phosphotransferase system IIB-like protein
MSAPVDQSVGTLRSILRNQMLDAATHQDADRIVACASAHGLDVTR